jgi:hypothetical protein
MLQARIQAQDDTEDRKDGKGKVPWNYRLSPKETGSIDVIVNTENLPKGYVIVEVFFRVAFYDSKGTLLGKSTFHLTDENGPPLERKRHQRKFNHAYNRATRVGAGVLYYLLREKGTRLGEPHLYFEKETDSTLKMDDN